MSTTYDASSEIFSLYSHPPMTRASTCSQGTQPLVTPMDDGVQYPSAKYGRNRVQCAEGVRIASTTPDDGYLSRESALQIIDEHAQPEPYESYFSIPRPSPATSPPSGLSRRGTTKELIGRFESMSPTKSPSSYYQESPRTRPGAYQAVQKTNKRSPIRQSIRNFLSVFKKSTSRASGERSDLLSVAEDMTCEPPPGRASPSGASTSSAHNYSSALDVPKVSPARQALSICTTPLSPTAARHSGAVVHLCRPLTSSRGIHPVWAHCTATLHSTHLLLTTETSGGNPSTNIITFRECADVRSLSTTELEANERAMLPTQDAQGRDGQVWKIFELLFEGRPKERFAVHSVGERAAWVSKIWDAILEAQEERTEAASIAARRVRSIASAEAATPIIARSPVSGQHSAMSDQSSTRTGSFLSPERSLPALPPPTEKPSAPKLRIDIPTTSPIRSSAPATPSKLSPLPRPPTTPTRTPTRTQSPSIMNLDKRSMVKQRLAQLESSAGSPTSARGSPLQSASPSVSRARSLRHGPDSSTGIHRQATSTSGVVDSLLESYRTTPISSPLSASSGRLTTIGPSSPSRSPATSAFLKPLPHLADLFSPASRYSTDDEVVIRPSLSALEPMADPASSAARRPMIRLDTDAGPVQKPVAVRDEQRPLPNVPVHLREEPVSRPRAISPPFCVTLRDEPRTVPSNPPETPPTSRAVHRSPMDIPTVDERNRPLAGTAAEHGALSEIQGKVDAILDRLRQQGNGTSSTPTVDLSNVLTRLDGLRAEMHNTTQASVMRSPAAPAEMGRLHNKLDALASVCQSLHDREPAQSASGGELPEIAEVMALLQGAQEQWSLHTEQQTDSIRYLNELNTWLEAFVNHGTSQIENVAAGIQMLCKELGPISEPQEAGKTGDEQPPQMSLLADVRQLLLDAKGQEEGSAALHVAVNGLIAAVQEDLRKNAEARNTLTTESVVGLIDRQRQDQERMLRSLGTELSNEIRGERLRFVEAMKEATQINVQMHVEHFKKELTREVMLTTQEVSRLQRERQGLEQQIADLFAFYSKQKQAGAQLLQPAQQPSARRHHARSRSIGPPAATPIPIPGAPAGSLPGTMPVQGMPRRPLPTPSPTSRRPASAFA